jgi:two-component system, OmpR family, alkaline phosphatase synthesis response regulator PhoP
MNHTNFLRRRKILVVEDQTELLELLRLHFKEEGFAIATATNGVDAIRKARSLAPDLIVLDVMLPELDGFAVCEILRREPATASVPIIMVTGLPGQLTRCAGIESGATDFITKPVSPTRLLARIKEIFQQRSASAEAPKPAAPDIKAV